MLFLLIIRNHLQGYEKNDRLLGYLRAEFVISKSFPGSVYSSVRIILIIQNNLDPK